MTEETNRSCSGSEGALTVSPVSISFSFTSFHIHIHFVPVILKSVSTGVFLNYFETKVVKGW